MSLLIKIFYLSISLQEDELNDAILVVLANKQDMEGCMSVAEVHQALGLEALKNRTFQVTKKLQKLTDVLLNLKKTFQIFKTSATKGEGLDQAMDWLSNALQTRK